MFWKKKPFPEILFLLLISAVVYLPRIGSLTYFKDDWYYIYNGMAAGAKIFHEMFSIDRPARGYFFELYYSLFGPQPLPYHLGAYVWRVIAGLSALSIFNMLWPNNRKFVFFTALLFTIYPGFFWWVSAIEYQPMIASLALQVISILFTLKAIQSSSRVSKIIYLIGSILTGWFYIALVDYAIGMEVFRFLCVYILVSRNGQLGIWNRLLGTFRIWIWYLLIPLGFLVWRVFFFTNKRKATDIGGQLSVFLSNPAATVVEWFFQLYNSLLNISVLAWINQFPAFLQGLRLRDTAFGLFSTAIILLLVGFAERTIKQSADSNVEGDDQARYRQEALFLGALGMVFGVLPVVMANRYVNILGFSHYGLPASLAAAVFMAGFVDSLSMPRARSVILYILIAFASLAHYGIANNAMGEETAIQRFWWQVSWRVPALRPDTTLVINYPAPNIGDDGYGVVEAAGMVYFPSPSIEVPVHYNVSAVTLSDSNLQDILQGTLARRTEYRSNTVNYDFGNVLVISQPTPASCVHVIDGHRPFVSELDPLNVMLAAPSSNIENVLVDAGPFIPQDFAFGSEPDHTWCYYYEKAELALQSGKWDEVVSLGEDAIRLGLHPEDQFEWLPFLEAYAIMGNEKRVAQTATIITGDRFLRQQACNMFMQIEDPLKPEIRELISTLYCRNSK